MRNGRRNGKSAAFREWNNLHPDDQKLVVRAVPIYTKNLGDFFAMDFRRFISSGEFLDHQTVGVNGKPARSRLVAPPPIMEMNSNGRR